MAGMAAVFSGGLEEGFNLEGARVQGVLAAFVKPVLTRSI